MLVLQLLWVLHYLNGSLPGSESKPPRSAGVPVELSKSDVMWHTAEGTNKPDLRALKWRHGFMFFPIWLNDSYDRCSIDAFLAHLGIKPMET